MTRPTAALAAVFVPFLLGCAGNSVSSSFAHRGAVRHVVAHVEVGTLVVSPSRTEAGARVTVTMSCRTAVPPIDLRVEEETLFVTTNVGTGASACDGLFELSVPATATLDLHADRGDVSLTQHAGEISVVAFDGDVTLDQVTGSFDVTAVSGRVSGQGLRSDASVVTGGDTDVDLSYEIVPTLVDIELSVGATRVSVPHAEYEVEAHTTAGQVALVGLTDQPGAPHGIWTRAGQGDITLAAR